MNPGAFANPTVRPGLHNRSVTSPIMSMKQAPPRLQNDLLSGDEAGDEPEPFSDDDISIGRTHTGGSQESHHTAKHPGIGAGFRQGLRRLTGGNGSRRDAREAVKAVTSISTKGPRVPKLPAHLLPGQPMSADP
ncbi:hypothetical protein KC352_g20806 [Hortaea werneckii]|nr:hypothetical protein KC352_g20806 [Hortaea werneckii]